jgi:hypothetical protein
LIARKQSKFKCVKKWHLNTWYLNKRNKDGGLSVGWFEKLNFYKNELEIASRQIFQANIL